jgi:adenosylcobyric acid synthase
MTARPLMILGTSSHVGKSILTAAFCRIFASDGYSVAPFKSQNMSLNSAATPEGLEIGRAQALQAEAAQVVASVHMNPILLKPTRDTMSQVIVHGKIWANLSAAEYHEWRVHELLPLIGQSYRWLAARNDVVVIEGAGSPAEINLKKNDIANMRVAELADAPCILVGDIDRGGVFASLLGTMELLEPHERVRIRGFLVNKFRGDIALLTHGLRMIEERMGIPCLGVIPYLRNLALDEEDSVGLETGAIRSWSHDESLLRPLRVAVVALPYLSNFTDFAALHAEPSVELRYCRKPEEAVQADVVILPGSKQTIDDLRWLRANGWEPVLRACASHRCLIGICGGMQMLGEHIADDDAVEGGGEESGFGLLPLRTAMLREKVTTPVQAYVEAEGWLNGELAGLSLRGYEIHVGETTYIGDAKPLFNMKRAPDYHLEFEDGCVSDDGRVIGTYLHGLFDEDSFRHRWIGAMRRSLGLADAALLVNWKQRREEELNRLRDTVRDAVDLSAICELMGLPVRAYAESSRG